ncbi:MAG: asparagine synthase (glutamine-hydrolyzing) [Phycisphaerales bacterium]
MCGIAGLIALDGSVPDLRVVESMTAAVAHRGPDGAGTALRGSVAFGHRRLAILDLSPEGRQPMESADGSLSITFNGEIYNYLELREELRALGHRFRTGTDTEVLLAAYAQWGPRCVDRCNGMWAFAIHDARTQTVFCSRDRFGVKPFCFARLGTRLAFGSEPAQLLPLLPRVRADRATLEGFLFAGIDEPVERTFFEGIEKLPGGHSLTIDLRSGACEIRREYEIGRPAGLASLDPEAAAQAYGERLREAVSLRLRADVPVGTCLSGGLDSSAVAALASEPYRAARGERFRAITAVSEEAGNDETPFAGAVAQRSALDWITIRPSTADFVATIEDVVRTQQEPFGGPSICMQWFVMRTAREQGVPVLLDGQGGDETLLGYRRYFAAFMLERWRARGLGAMLREMRACRRNGAQVGTARLLLNLLVQGSPTVARWKLRLRARWAREMPPLPAIVEEEARTMNDLDALQRLDIARTSLPPLLRFEDRNSMRFAVETRLPFLDWRSVETALALAPEAKFREGWTKWALRRCMEGTLPTEVVWRRWKIGFEAPTRTWLAHHDAAMREAVAGSRLLAQYGRPGFADEGFSRLHHSVRWRLYSVAMWERAFGVE